MVRDDFSFAEIEALKPCAPALRWLRERWPPWRERWTVREAVAAGADDHWATWLFFEVHEMHIARDLFFAQRRCFLRLDVKPRAWRWRLALIEALESPYAET